MSEQTTQPDPSTLEQPEPRHVLVRIDHGAVVVIQPIGRREAEARRLEVLEESAYLPSGRLKPVERIPVEKPSEDAQDADQGETPLVDTAPDAAPAAEPDAQAGAAPKGKTPKTSAATAAKKTDATPAPGSTTPEEK